jgi:cytochrome c peroxidase
MNQPFRLFRILSLAGLILLFALACKKKNNDLINQPPGPDPLAALNLPSSPFNYANPVLPAYLLAPPIAAQDNTPANNPVTNQGATLGRVIFYDKIVSINNSVSCASCHKQALSFADNGALSTGFDGQFTGRNSMPLINARYYPNGRFFWDERARSLEEQVLMPVQDHKEMGMRLDTLVARMQRQPHYPVLFNNAFGSSSITTERISFALSQFIRSMISTQSKFDSGRAQVGPGAGLGAAYPNFTAQENLGKQLFFGPVGACGTCHGTETFTAPGDRNNGIENPSVDQGKGAITGNGVQIGNFKVGSLKNIELTAPYMHDGRFANLEQVVEHYNSGIQPHPNLAPQLKNPDGSPRRLNLTANEKAAMVAFLKTLTDRTITADVKFSNPFR